MKQENFRIEANRIFLSTDKRIYTKIVHACAHFFSPACNAWLKIALGSHWKIVFNTSLVVTGLISHYFISVTTNWAMSQWLRYFCSFEQRKNGLSLYLTCFRRRKEKLKATCSNLLERWSGFSALFWWKNTDTMSPSQWLLVIFIHSLMEKYRCFGLTVFFNLSFASRARIAHCR